MCMLFIQSQHFEMFDLEDEQKCARTREWNEPA